MDFANLRLYDNYGAGLVIHGVPDGSPNSHPGPAHFRMVNVKIEQSGMSQQSEVDSSGAIVRVQGDNMQLGDAGASGYPGLGVRQFYCQNLELTNPVTGSAALHVYAGSSGISCSGAIGAVNVDGGMGLQVDSCSNCSFRMNANTANDYQFLVGSLASGACSGANLTAPLTYDGNGQEAALSTCIDPASAGFVRYPVAQYFAPAPAGNSPSSPLADLTSQITTAASSCPSTAPCTFATPGGTFQISPFAPLWTILRSGPTSAFYDQWDTAAHIIASLSAGLPGTQIVAGQIFRARVCNQTSVTDTVAPNTGEMGNAVSIAPGACASFALTINNVAAMMQAITINGV